MFAFFPCIQVPCQIETAPFGGIFIRSGITRVFNKGCSLSSNKWVLGLWTDLNLDHDFPLNQKTKVHLPTLDFCLLLHKPTSTLVLWLLYTKYTMLFSLSPQIQTGQDTLDATLALLPWQQSLLPCIRHQVLHMVSAIWNPTTLLKVGSPGPEQHVLLLALVYRGSYYSITQWHQYPYHQWALQPSREGSIL